MVWFVPSVTTVLRAAMLVLAWLGMLGGFASAMETDAPGIGAKRKLIAFITTTILAAAPSIFIPNEGNDDDDDDVPSGHMPPLVSRHRGRTRKTVAGIMDELGPYYVRRAYRMHSVDFDKLYSLLQSFLGSPNQTADNKLKGAKNRSITGELRLSVALRHFAGGRPEDISLVHGISHSEVFNSIWKVVDAVNKCPELAFKYPESHVEQQLIADGFKSKSFPGFSVCAGAIDCMLIWIEKPNAEQCRISQVGEKKWFCGRKKKFGVCLQATCDVDGKFLDVAMEHPASTSDFLAFTTSGLYHKLKKPDFLAPGLCLFGDNAYVNCQCMAMPYRQSTAGTNEDHYNFFHSQVSV